MSILVWIGLGLLVAFIFLMISGFGSDAVFKNPETLSDAHLERTIRLSQRIMDSSPIGTERWNKAGEKFSAAFREQMRRRGTPLAELDFGETGTSNASDQSEFDYPQVEGLDDDDLDISDDDVGQR